MDELINKFIMSEIWYIHNGVINHRDEEYNYVTHREIYTFGDYYQSNSERQITTHFSLIHRLDSNINTDTHI